MFVYHRSHLKYLLRRTFLTFSSSLLFLFDKAKEKCKNKGETVLLPQLELKQHPVGERSLAISWRRQSTYVTTISRVNWASRSTRNELARKLGHTLYTILRSHCERAQGVLHEWFRCVLQKTQGKWLLNQWTELSVPWEDLKDLRERFRFSACIFPVRFFRNHLVKCSYPVCI